MTAILYMPNHNRGPGWYFFDQFWSETYGPYADEEKAKLALSQYASDLDKPSTYEEDHLMSPIEGVKFWAEEHNIAAEGELKNPEFTTEQTQHAWLEQIERKKPIVVETRGDLYELDGIVDGGYLSFIYGSRTGNFGGWDTAKFKYSNFLILMDSGGVRKSEYEPYKSRRVERRNQYDYMRNTYEQVKILRGLMLEDPTVRTSYLDGYEADDLIALLFLKGIGNKRVIAQDKDMFMVKGLRDVMFDHTGIPQRTRGLKLPKYALKPNGPASWAFTQAIFGDKSDSIPRLLPSRSGYKQEYDMLVRRASSILEAYYFAYQHYGEQFLINLRLVLLPHPTLAMVDYNDHNQLFVDLAKGRYWYPENYDDWIIDTILENMKIKGDTW